MVNFAVPLPAAGANAILAFDFSDLEKLEKKLGVGYLAKVFDGLKNDDTSVIRTAVTIGVKGGDPESALSKMPLSDLGMAIADALNRRISGQPE